MKRTPIGALAGGFVFFTAFMAIIARFYYGALPALPAAGPVMVWLLVIVCGVLVVVVRTAMKEGRVGLDRSQLDPLTMARIMVVGTAAAWTGAIVGGLYAGLAVYVVPRAELLVAAGNELPIVISGALGGVVLSVAGIVVERSCETPPSSDGVFR